MNWLIANIDGNLTNNNYGIPDCIFRYCCNTILPYSVGDALKSSILQLSSIILSANLVYKLLNHIDLQNS